MTESNAIHWNRELRVYLGEYSAKLLGGALSLPQLFVATGGIYLQGDPLDTLRLRIHDAGSGQQIWIPWSDVTAAWVPDDSVTTAFGTALAGDEAGVADLSDADGDGLLAVDEALRFGTDPQKADSDDDGVPDKIEIYSYRFGKGVVPRTADIDNDGLRAELDPDSDDGCSDGEEDRNRNGKYRPITLVSINGVTEEATATEEGETDPFWEDEIKLSLQSIHLYDLHTAISDKVTLLVDGEVAPGREWTRRSTKDYPTTWEVRIAATNMSEPFIPHQMFPRYLYVQAGAGYLWNEPLLWWAGCRAEGYRRLAMSSCGQSPGVWGELYEYFEPERIYKRASFFFGDSSLIDGSDAYGHQWPAQTRTGVGFIPVGVVGGNPVGMSLAIGSRLRECREGSDGYARYAIFSVDKRFAGFELIPQWSVKYLGNPPLCLSTGECARVWESLSESMLARIESLGPVPLRPLLDDITFQRDYLENERIFIRSLGLEVPEPHIIRMRNGEE